MRIARISQPQSQWDGPEQSPTSKAKHKAAKSMFEWEFS
jgi:hypothetical protein